MEFQLNVLANNLPLNCTDRPPENPPVNGKAKTPDPHRFASPAERDQLRGELDALLRRRYPELIGLHDPADRSTRWLIEQ